MLFAVSTYANYNVCSFFDSPCRTLSPGFGIVYMKVSYHDVSHHDSHFETPDSRFRHVFL